MPPMRVPGSVRVPRLDSSNLGRVGLAGGLLSIERGRVRRERHRSIGCRGIEEPVVGGPHVPACGSPIAVQLDQSIDQVRAYLGAHNRHRRSSLARAQGPIRGPMAGPKAGRPACHAESLGLTIFGQWTSISPWIERHRCGPSWSVSCAQRYVRVGCVPGRSCRRAACSPMSSRCRGASWSRRTRNWSPRVISWHAPGTGRGSRMGLRSSRLHRACRPGQRAEFGTTCAAGCPTCPTFPAASGSRRWRWRCAICPTRPCRTGRAGACVSCGSR